MKGTLEDRFWAKVTKTPNGCWEWAASVRPRRPRGKKALAAYRPKPGAVGYGQIGIFLDGAWTVRAAHRVAFYLKHGRWPSPCALHECDNPRCVRVETGHVVEGTHAENTRHMVRRGRAVVQAKATACSKGHAIEGGNAKPNGAGRVVCRICFNEWAQRRYREGKTR